MRSMLWHMAIVAILGLGVSTGSAADAPVAPISVIPAAMPSVSTVATASAAAQPIIPTSGNLGGNGGTVVKSHCPSCQAQAISGAVSTTCGACSSCGQTGLHLHGCGLRNGCNRWAGFGFGQCVTPLGSGNAGTPGICVYGSYNLR
ncbi:MAG: hypothetical protein LC104_03285 [Bacteroidales bacterium]|nr:hypothetical protein [Bacteroidales bacterium]